MRLPACLLSSLLLSSSPIFSIFSIFLLLPSSSWGRTSLPFYLSTIPRFRIYPAVSHLNGLPRLCRTEPFPRASSPSRRPREAPAPRPRRRAFGRRAPSPSADVCPRVRSTRGPSRLIFDASWLRGSSSRGPSSRASSTVAAPETTRNSRSRTGRQELGDLVVDGRASMAGHTPRAHASQGRTHRKGLPAPPTGRDDYDALLHWHGRRADLSEAS